MKPALFVAAAATAFSGAAAAQSSASVYGLIDMSINHMRFSGTATRPSASQTTVSNDASRIGFRASEDLGGGRRAYFKLESGVSLDTGASTNATQFWNLESYVGIADPKLGSVQLGSQFTPAVWASSRVDPFGRFGLGAITNLLQGSPRGWAVTFNNSAQYISPKFGDATVRLMAAPSEGAVTGRSYAGAIEYAKDRLYLTANYDDVGVTNAAVGLPGSGTVRSRTYIAAAAYSFDAVKLSGWYQANRAGDAPDLTGYMLGATVPLSSSELRASVTRRSMSGASVSRLALGYYHFLSKRTWLFTQVARMENSGSAAFGLGPARVEQAAAGLLAADRDINGLQLGVRHFF
ncbi:MAG: porin [Rubrivivax sp.]